MCRYLIRILCFIFTMGVCTELRAIEENQGWPVDWHSNMGCPLIIDFNDDGSLEVIIGCFGDSLGAWSFDGQPLAGWPKLLPNHYEDEVAGGDIDNDGRIEVVLAVFDTSTTALALRSDGTQTEG